MPAGSTTRIHSSGEAVENSYIESFNGRLRDECLNVTVFFSLADIRQQLERWRKHYNAKRPHSALDDRTPNEFAALWEKGRFALSSVNRAVASPRQGFPDGALARGPDPAAQPPKPLAMRAKLSSRIRPLVRVP